MSVYFDNLIYLAFGLKLIAFYHDSEISIEPEIVTSRLLEFSQSPRNSIYAHTLKRLLTTDVDAQVINFVKIVKCSPVDLSASFCWPPLHSKLTTFSFSEIVTAICN